jgi:hypothetical protein
MPNIITRTEQRKAVSRPLKVLVPLIQSELIQGDTAGLEHYRRAGRLLIESQINLIHESWVSWINKNFDLSLRTAQRYMRLARQEEDRADIGADKTHNKINGLFAAIGEKTSNERRKPLHEAITRVNVERFAEERRIKQEEIKTHREMALELIDLGYRALATRLHPDRRGGSREAMTRLNAVRDELKSVASTRRFI